MYNNSARKFKENIQKIMHGALEKFGFSIITSPQRQAFVDDQASDSGVDYLSEITFFRISFGAPGGHELAVWRSDIIHTIFAEIAEAIRDLEVCFAGRLDVGSG